MKTYLAINPDGTIHSSIMIGDAVSPPDLGGGVQWVDVSGAPVPTDMGNWKYVDGGLEPYEAPTPVPPPQTLEQARASRWAQIKAEFRQRNTAPLDAGTLGIFDADAESALKITQVVLLARTLTELQQPVAINFVRYDNSVVVLDLDKAIQLGLALAAREQALRNRRQELRLEIEAAATVADVAAITWDVGGD